MIHEQFSP